MPTHSTSPSFDSAAGPAAKRPRKRKEKAKSPAVATEPSKSPAEDEPEQSSAAGESETSGQLEQLALAAPSSSRPATSTNPSPDVPPRFTCTPHSSYGWDLEHRSPIAVDATSGPALLDLPICTIQEAEGKAPAGELFTAKAFAGFIGKFDKPSHATAATVSKHRDPPHPAPELVVGSSIGKGRLWQVQKGELKLPRPAGSLPEPAPGPTYHEIKAAMAKVIRGRGYGDMLGSECDADATPDPATPMDSTARPLDTTRTLIEVAVKFACPAAHARRESRERREAHKAKASTPSDDYYESDSSVASYDIHDNEWQYSAKAIENLKSIAGVYIPAYYGLWSFKIGADTVYMMIQERTADAEEESVTIQSYVRPATERAICMAYSAIHNANVVTKDLKLDHIRVTTDPTAFARRLMEKLSFGSSKALSPSKPINIRIIDFDEALDLSELPADEQEAYKARERQSLHGRYSIRTSTWDKVRNQTELEDLWEGKYSNDEDDDHRDLDKERDRLGTWGRWRM